MGAASFRSGLDKIELLERAEILKAESSKTVHSKRRRNGSSGDG